MVFLRNIIKKLLQKEVSVKAEPKDERVPLMMEASLLDQIDGYRLAHKVWSRGEAIRKLVKVGLEKEMPASAGE
jgi:metal-responsive CopG/Arc/MetJ family transcriptional regulator